jgi:hypothetical protein
MSTVRVVALERGHDGRILREAGEQFEVNESRLKDGSTWFVPVAKAPKAKPENPNARPPGAGPAKGSAEPEAPPDDLA